MKAVKKDQEVLLSTAEASGRPSPPTPPHVLLATHNWGPLRGAVGRALLKGDRLGLPEANNQGRRKDSGGNADTLTAPSPGQGPSSRSPVLTARDAPRLLALTSLMHLKEMRGDSDSVRTVTKAVNLRVVSGSPSKFSFHAPLQLAAAHTFWPPFS